MLTEGARSSDQNVWEPKYTVHIKIVDGGNSASLIHFLTGIGLEFYESQSQRVHWVSAYRVPRSQIGPLSELPDVELVRRPSPANLPGTSITPRLPSNAEAENQETISQTLTEAPVWHGAKSWHDADPPLNGDGVRIGVIDIGFNGFKQLQMPGDVPSSAK